MSSEFLGLKPEIYILSQLPRDAPASYSFKNTELDVLCSFLRHKIFITQSLF